MEGKRMPYEQTWWQVLTFSGVVGKRGMKKKLGGRNPTVSHRVLSSASGDRQ